ncbi:MAG TPA: high-potential iron-sulfur protein [Candidatus Rubrimentiphilum sp.]|nr:high-potential iron-sulfur protein [Candidatus Rubrimentiphilum sp.]
MSESPKFTRKEALKTVVVLPALAALISPAIADAKMSQRAAGYKNTPGPMRRKCSGCRFFQKPHSCSLVAGTISPNGWCKYWAKK